MMKIEYGHVEELFNLYLPNYQCTLELAYDGSATLRFRSRANDDAITVVGVAVSQLQSPQSIRHMCRNVKEEFAVTCAPGVGASET